MGWDVTVVTMMDFLILTKGVWASIKNTHPNKDIDERFKVIAGSVAHPFLRIAKKYSC